MPGSSDFQAPSKNTEQPGLVCRVLALVQSIIYTEKTRAQLNCAFWPRHGLNSNGHYTKGGVINDFSKNGSE